MRKCLESMFYLHNEFGNIWTHLLGAVVFTVFTVYVGNFVLHDHHWLVCGAPA
jgi:adiponectin receptor